jgi:hypothetical protein
MPFDLSSHKLEAGCALSAAVFVAIWRVWKLKSVDGEFLGSIIEALLAGAFLPAAAIFIWSPFDDAPFDLVRYKVYLLLSGIALLYAFFIIIRRSLR